MQVDLKNARKEESSNASRLIMPRVISDSDFRALLLKKHDTHCCQKNHCEAK